MSTLKMILSNLDSPESVLDDIGIIKLVSGELVISSVVPIDNGIALIMPYTIESDHSLVPLIPFTHDRCFPFKRDSIQTIKMSIFQSTRDQYKKTRETVGLSDLSAFWDTIKEIANDREAMLDISEALNMDPILSNDDVPNDRVLH